MRAALRSAAALAGATMLASCVAPGPHQKARPAVEGKAAGADLDGLTNVEVKGAWLRVKVQGPVESGALPVVFLHGYGSRLEGFRDVQPLLATDRATVSFDQRGFGLSERPAGGYGPGAHADDVIALMDALGIERAVLVGHSYGGGVALRAALDHKDRVAGVGLIGAFVFDSQVTTTFRWAQVPVVGELLFGAFYDEVPGEKYLLAFQDRGRFVSVAALDEMQALMAREGSTYAALETVRGMDYANVEHRYAGIGVPAIVIQGRDDRVVKHRDGERLAAVLDAPYVELPATGHMPTWEQPQQTASALRQLLAVVDAAEAARRAEDAAMPKGTADPAPQPQPQPAPSDDVGATP